MFIREWFKLLDEIVYKYLNYCVKEFKLDISKNVEEYSEVRFFVKLFTRIGSVLCLLVLEAILCISLIILTVGNPGLMFMILYLPIILLVIYYNYENIQEVIEKWNTKMNSIELKN